jgi:hypothetical protein
MPESTAVVLRSRLVTGKRTAAAGQIFPGRIHSKGKRVMPATRVARGHLRDRFVTTCVAPLPTTDAPLNNRIPSP